jgi:hypothetical protein
MPDIPVLYTSESATLTYAATYSRIWVREVVISSPQIGGEAEARVMLTRYRLTDDGVEEAPAEPLRLHLKDLLSSADSDPDLAAVVESLMKYVAKAGIAEGLIAAPE